MSEVISPVTFRRRLLRWYQQHGRHDLPWQKTVTPYRVWVSEIMLQQTQVTTVIPYYERFMQSFPTIRALARAPAEQVLAHWAGLGYYARARNLHRCAQVICSEYQGQFPNTVSILESLPGIGRSTAGAIVAFAFGGYAPILDGNVKRVLTRLHAIAGTPDSPTIKARLWDIAERYTPHKHIEQFTQAIMDLGATVCTRSKPNCSQCPFAKQCLAHSLGQETAFPQKNKSKKKPVKSIYMVMCANQRKECLLMKRPDKGIWGGLWSFPEFAELNAGADWCNRHIGKSTGLETWPQFRHSFTHYHLDITPVYVKMARTKLKLPADATWENIHTLSKGIPAPVQKLINQMGQVGF